MSILNKINEIKSIKENIKQSIIDKGVIISSSDNFATYPEKIASIESGIKPTGTLKVTENNTYDVTDYGEIVVAVETPVNNQSITINANGVYSADTGYNGISKAIVNVEPFTTSEIIDSELRGKQFTDSTFTLPNNITSLGGYALPMCYFNNGYITTVNLSNIRTIDGNNALDNTFSGCYSLKTVDLSGLESIYGNNALYNTFNNCNSLESVDLSSLTSINGHQACSRMFSWCQNLSNISFSSLKSIIGYGIFIGTFNACPIISMTFPNLTLLDGSQIFSFAFEQSQLQTLSFPALTSNSFGTNTDQFNSMLSNCENVTVHFPSNLQSVIGSWQDVINGFGGTNTTVLFDLPATK